MGVNKKVAIRVKRRMWRKELVVVSYSCDMD